MKIGKVKDVAIEMHPALPIFMAAMCMLGLQRVLAVGVAVLTLHELAHALVARILGFQIVSMELMPFGACARLEGMREELGWRGAVIALAGPLMNALLVVLAMAGVGSGWVPRVDALLFVRVNLVLMAFNLLPVLPLDGGRILYALCAGRFGKERCLRIFSRAGEAVGLAVIALGVYGAIYGILNLTLFLTGSYLVYAAAKERQTPGMGGVRTVLCHVQKLTRRGVLPVRSMLVRADLPIAALAGGLSAQAYGDFQVVDDRLRPLGTLREDALLAALMENPGQSVLEVLRAREAENGQKRASGTKVKKD